MRRATPNPTSMAAAPAKLAYAVPRANALRWLSSRIVASVGSAASMASSVGVASLGMACCSAA